MPVTLRLRGLEFQGLAEPVADDKQAVAAGLVVLLPQVSPPAQTTLYNVERFLALIEGPKLSFSQFATFMLNGGAPAKVRLLTLDDGRSF